MNIAYTSENKIYKLENGSKTEIPCGRIIKYKEAVDSIRRRNEWKTTGMGAMFTGAAMAQPDSENVTARISGISENGGMLIYGAALDESSCLYSRSFDRNDMNEGLILSGNDVYFGGFDCFEGKMAVSMGHSYSERHIAVMEPPSSDYTEYTDGDSLEETPYWSRFHKNRIYFSAAGNARGDYGGVSAVSPRSGAYIDIDRGEMEEFLSDPQADFLKIKDDSRGNIYYIRQPYGGEKEKDGIKPSDVLLFPVRIGKAIFGWLDYESTRWGGEPLKGGSRPGSTRTKDRHPKDIIIDGNIIKAERLANEASLKEDDMSGLMPLSRTLVKREADGSETVVKKGVLDYCICRDGKILVSNGRHIILLDGEKETHIAKAHLAVNLTEF
ncbi:MAG: hypothetical protein NC120_08750 [Ruminococcus sp.]|nr:hypothetical protein [Ruminococcus sp.]